MAGGQGAGASGEDDLNSRQLAQTGNGCASSSSLFLVLITTTRQFSPHITQTHTAAADDFTYAAHPRPFKNPNYSRGASTVGARKNKQLKQVLALERERVDRVLEGRKEAALAKVESEMGEEREDESEEKKQERRRRREEAVQGVMHDVVSYASVEAPPSLLPPKRYCDVTGLEAKYLDPKSTLRYHNPEVYEVLRSFQPAVIQAYLAVRGMGVVLR